MNWGGWDNFWAMGGYGLYVWGSYAVTLAVIAAEIGLLRVRRRNALDALKQAVRGRTS
ncbi:MAG: heme exporter protein CcmD [Betaproteobacteria bacterium]|nr:heme exporter protein CcmD [Betaproteobacteria bacterium]